MQTGRKRRCRLHRQDRWTDVRRLWYLVLWTCGWGSNRLQPRREFVQECNPVSCTPDVVWNQLDSELAWAPVFSCKATMRSIRISGTPVLCSAFHRARRSTESKAALMSKYATFSGQSNSRRSSDKRRTARMASIVDRPAVKPDWCGLRVLSRSDWIRAKRTWANSAGDGEKCYWSVVAAVCLVTFSLVQCDYNTILVWYAACSPDG